MSASHVEQDTGLYGTGICYVKQCLFEAVGVAKQQERWGKKSDSCQGNRCGLQLDFQFGGRIIRAAGQSEQLDKRRLDK